MPEVEVTTGKVVRLGGLLVKGNVLHIRDEVSKKLEIGFVDSVLEGLSIQS